MYIMLLYTKKDPNGKSCREIYVDIWRVIISCNSISKNGRFYGEFYSHSEADDNL